MACRQKIVIFLCSIVLLSLDFISKEYTFQNIPPMYWSSSVYPYGGIPVFQNFCGIDFSLNYVMNKGAAWGVFSSFQSYLLYARFLIIGALLAYTCFARLSFGRKLCLFLILTGAVGNVVDYFLYGHVVDLFHFRFWNYDFPVFNVADSVIFCAVTALMCLNLFEKHKKSIV